MVTAFYTSNVEQYLFRNEVAIDVLRQRRHVADRRSERLHSIGVASQRHRPVGDLLTAVREGQILEYGDVARRGTIAP